MAHYVRGKMSENLQNFEGGSLRRLKHVDYTHGYKYLIKIKDGSLRRQKYEGM